MKVDDDVLLNVDLLAAQLQRRNLKRSIMGHAFVKGNFGVVVGDLLDYWEEYSAYQLDKYVTDETSNQPCMGRGSVGPCVMENVYRSASGCIYLYLFQAPT